MTIWDDLKYQFRAGGLAQRIIFVNIALFALPFAIKGILFLFGISFPFQTWFGLSSSFSDLLFKPWTIVTYGFLHAGFFHILFNLIIFNFSARIYNTYFSDKQLLSHYLLGILYSGLFYMLSYLVFPQLYNSQGLLVGASGGVIALLVSIATFQPHTEVRLLLIGSVKLWHIALFYFFLSLIGLSSSNTGGNLAHIGGAVYGYLYGKSMAQGNDISLWFSKLMDYVTNVFRQTSPSKKTKLRPVKNEGRPVTPTYKNKDQAKIDAILDKISQSGYDSLSKEEKEFLFNQKD